MSSLRNAVKRRTHKERSQPAERRKFGLLEKKKDYVLRARDFHKKEEALKVLRKKAANRNPDEFYFAMQKQRTVDGVHNANQDESNKYTQDELHLMKTQDVKYVAMKASMEAKKVERLRATLHMIGDVPGDDDGDDDDETFDAMKAFGSDRGKKQERVHVVFGDDSDDEDDDARLRRAKPKARAGPRTKQAGEDDGWGDDDDDDGGVGGVVFLSEILRRRRPPPRRRCALSRRYEMKKDSRFCSVLFCRPNRQPIRSVQNHQRHGRDHDSSRQESPEAEPPS